MLELLGPEPKALTQEHAVSGVQSLPDGRILFMENSFNGPNNVYYLRQVGDNYSKVQVTNFGEELLKTKDFAPYEEFWFQGANDVKVQGWAIKPHGWKADQKAKWLVFDLFHCGEDPSYRFARPVVLLIHGGLFETLLSM